MYIVVVCWPAFPAWQHRCCRAIAAPPRSMNTEVCRFERRFRDLREADVHARYYRKQGYQVELHYICK